jgi:hypothetical protein
MIDIVNNESTGRPCCRRLRASLTRRRP